MFVSVSTMPAGNKLFEYIKEIENFADFLHCDVCDGKYNQSVCFDAETATQINSKTTLPLDVHLMTQNVLEQTQKYIKAGANIITAQIESFNSETQVLEFIKLCNKNNVLVGLSLEPSTPVQKIKKYLPNIDVVLVMAVQTGKSGQNFQDIAIEKIKYLSNLKSKHNFKIQVDGGIDSSTAKVVSSLGADMVVSGSYVFSSKNKKQAIDILKNI